MMRSLLKFVVLFPSVICASIIALLSNAEAQQILIELNDSSSETDDYLCWSPLHGRVRIAGTAAAPVAIQLRSESAQSGGAVSFQADSGALPLPTSFNPVDVLDLVL